LESDLGSLHGLRRAFDRGAAAVIDREQTPVAEGDAVNVGSQVFESSLPVADVFAMDDPCSPPYF
jgi:hypothetical protein